jgi:hypothetical protein
MYNIKDLRINFDMDLSYYMLIIIFAYVLYRLYIHNIKCNKKPICPSSLKIKKPNIYLYKNSYANSFTDIYTNNKYCYINPHTHHTIAAKLGELAGSGVSTHSGRIVAAPFDNTNPYCY